MFVKDWRIFVWKMFLYPDIQLLTISCEYFLARRVINNPTMCHSSTVYLSIITGNRRIYLGNIKVNFPLFILSDISG